jgi:hypothetical protein
MNLKNFFRKLFQRDLKKNYVSDIDKFLWEFDEKHPDRSLSQQQEIKKYERVYRLRDNPKPEEEQTKLWE